MAMRGRVKNWYAGAALVGTCGYLMAGPGTSCSSYVGESTLVITDMCFIFDCQNGIFGGTLDPCSGIGSGNQTIEGGTQPPLFTDCPTNNGP